VCVTVVWSLTSDCGDGDIGDRMRAVVGGKGKRKRKRVQKEQR